MVTTARPAWLNVLAKAQRQRSLLRVEELLAERTKAIKETYSKVLRASRLASLGELVSGIAHEINNPVNGIMNCAEILVSDLKDDSENREFAEMIISEGKRVSSIVRRLVSFSKREHEEPAPMSLH